MKDDMDFSETEDKDAKGNSEYDRNGDGTLLSARVSQKSSKICAAFLLAFCALQIIDEFMAPIIAYRWIWMQP